MVVVGSAAVTVAVMMRTYKVDNQHLDGHDVGEWRMAKSPSPMIITRAEYPNYVPGQDPKKET